MKKILIAAAVLVVLSIIPLRNIWQKKAEQPITKEEAIERIKKQYPELKAYPSDELPPKSIMAEADGLNWYVAFVQNGSGKPILGARCFLVRPGAKIMESGKFALDMEGSNLKFSATKCNYIVTDQIVGGDKDEHGCIGSAGYSWCGAKEKCIRIWEEDCEIRKNIASALTEKEKTQITESMVTVTNETNKYARGKITFSPGEAGGMFLAAKTDDKWLIVYSGNGSIDCVGIKQKYEFPQEMLVGMCD